MDAFTSRFLNKQQLPLVIEPKQKGLKKEDFHKLLQENKEELQKLMLKYGGLLFRNFPIHDEHGFTEFITTLDVGRFVDYIGGDSPRNKIKEGIYTSTEAPPSIKIPLHNELSFVKHYPKHIFFYCHVPPVEKGETIIADARKVYQSVDKDVKMRFSAKGLKYVSCYYHKSSIMELVNKWQRAHKTWIDVFETSNKDEVERKCIENEFEFKWQKNDWLKITQNRPAIMTHPQTHETVWFNQAHLYDFNPKLLGLWRYIGAKLFYFQKHMRLHEVYFGDDSKIPRQDLYHVLNTLDANTIHFPWQKGDVLALDNVLTMHGRATFTGKRRILTAMTA